MTQIVGVDRIEVLIRRALCAFMLPMLTYGANSQAAEPQSGARAELAEVVVTAQRREQRANDTPLSITALDANAVRELAINSSADLVGIVANFSATDPGTSLQFNIRGQALVDYSDVNEAPVAVYMDDVYMAAPAAQGAQLFDMQRIEVLRGPQGTLFGRNASAGLVHFVSARPTAEQTGYANVQLGRFDQVIAEGAIGGAITSGIRFRAAARYNKDDGYQKNLGSGGGRFAATDVIAGRAMLEMDVIEQATLLLRAYGSRQRNSHVGYPYQGRLDSAGVECTPAQVLASACSSATGFRDPDPNPDHLYTEHTPDQLIDNADVLGGAAELNWRLPAATLTSITAYQTLKRDQVEDADANDRGIGNFGDFNYSPFYSLHQHQFTQEFRLAGGAATTKWIAGAFYFKDKRDARLGVQELSSASSPFDTAGSVDTKSWSLFGQVDQSVSDTVTLTGGLRYTNDRKDLSISTCDQFSGCPVFNADTFKIDSSNVSGRLGVEWRPIAGWLLYANGSNGFKSGEFNVTFLGGAVAAAAPVGAEKTTNLEIGSKSRLFDGSAQLNVSVFHTKTKGKQAIATTGVTSNELINIGSLVSYGAEIELSAKPVSKLELRLGVGLLHTEIQADSTVTISRNYARTPLQLDGNEFLNSPKASVNGAIKLNVLESDKAGSLDVQVDGRWQAKTFLDIANSPYDTQGSYGSLNLRSFWQSPDRHFRAEAFVENVSGEKWYARAVSIGGLDYRFSVWGSKPRLFGARVGYYF